jgi:capsular exopolysaccharide synthesis family protein
MPVEKNHPQSHQNAHLNGHNGHSNGHNGHLNGHRPIVSLSSPVPQIYPQDDLDLSQILQIARRRSMLIAAVAIAVTSAIWGWTLTRTAIYRGEFRVLVETAEEVDPSQQLLQNPEIKANTAFDYETQIEVLRSPALLEPIVEELQKTYPDISYGVLSSKLSISRLRDTKVLSVSYLDHSPKVIQAVLDQVSEHYLSYSYQQRQTSVQQGIQFVDDQLPELQNRVDSLQQKLEQFRQQYSLVDPESRGENLAEFLSSIEKQLHETQTQLYEARSLYTSLQQQLGYGPETALASSTLSESVSYQSILSQIQDVETQMAIESARFLSGSPNLQILIDKRDQLLPLLDAEAERLLGDRLTSSISDRLTPTSLELNRQLVSTANQVKVLEAKSNALAEVEERLKQEFSLVPALAREYTDLQRDLNVATTSLNRFLETRETLQIESAQKSIPWELISQAQVSGQPISPNVPKNLMLGAIAGLILGSAAALIAEKLDTAFHSSDELKTITRLPMLGMIPFDKDLQTPTTVQVSQTTAETLGQSDAPQTATATRSAAYHSSPFFEAFRSLYTNLQFLSSDTPIRSLVISSAAPADGKSTTAIYLARAAAAMGQRVLLVDSDLRRPQLHTRLKLPNLRGLSNLIATDLTLKQAVQHPYRDDPSNPDCDRNLFVLTAGPVPPDPVKLLSSRKMQNLMTQAQSLFDLIIYDTPPLIGFADSNLLATRTDGMMVVVGLGKTSRSTLLQALEALKISPISVLGIVTNGIKSYTTQSYGYYQYQHYYAHGESHAHSSRLLAKLPWSKPSIHHPEMSQVEESASPALLAFLSPQMRLLLMGGIGTIVLLVLVGWTAYQRMTQVPPENLPNRSPVSSSIEDGSPSLTSSPLLHSAQDPFAEAVRLAEAATEAGKTAQTPAEWFELSVQWQQASELMSMVLSEDERFAIAQDRVIVYRLNSDQARQKSEETSFLP